MYRYEMYLNRKNGTMISETTCKEIWSETSEKTIEHIYPKTFTEELNQKWQNENVKGQADLDKFVHHIGNLTLLTPGLNSSLGQKSFSEKKDQYPSLEINKGIFKKEKWTEKEIEEREGEILRFIEEEWK